MLLIIAHHYDMEAQWLFQTLKESSPLPVSLLLPEALGIDYSISLHLQNNGQHRSTIFFYRPEKQLESTEVCYAVNRLSYIDPIVWKHADPAEQAYAASEINAFFPALIHSLTCPVSNSIFNGALYGEGGYAGSWAGCLHRQGIAVHPLVTDTTGRLFEKLNGTPHEHLCRFMYFGEKLITPPGQDTVKEYAIIERSILKKGGAETLEFIFLKNGEDLELLQVSKTPSLSQYGQRFTDALLRRINEAHHDHTDGHTQRNSFAAAC